MFLHGVTFRVVWGKKRTRRNAREPVAGGAGQQRETLVDHIPLTYIEKSRLHTNDGASGTAHG